MLASLFFISTISQVFSCNTQCQSACQELNGKPGCYFSCACHPLPSKLVHPDSKSELASILKLKHVCYIEDVEFCENSTSTETDYYNCLEKVKCLVYQDGPKLLETLPVSLWPAVEPSFLSFPRPAKCETCKDEYFADEFYSCVYYNCQEKIAQSADLVKFVENNSKCRSCQLLGTGQSSCMWKECRKEIVNKQILFRSQDSLNVTCRDCEQIVFADDYYNCIALHCNDLWKAQSFDVLSGQSHSRCFACKAFEFQSEFSQCLKFSCRDEMLSRLEVDLTRFRKDCSMMLDQEYFECKNLEISQSSFNFWIFLIPFAVIAACFIAKIPKLSLGEPQDYIII